MGLYWEDAAKRQEIGDRFIQGDGIEIGAGADPSKYKGMRSVFYADKRSRADLEQHFGCPVNYEVATLEEIGYRRPGGYDFIVAHQVLEHMEDPIRGLAEWVRVLKPGGTLYISVPDVTNENEIERLPTPLCHMLDDFVFRRTEDDYESRQHIGCFMAQWARVRPENYPASTDGFVSMFLFNLNRSGHDLHWHTYSAETLRGVAECAFHVAGARAEILHVEVAVGSLHLVCRRGPRSRLQPAALREYRVHLESAIGRIRPTGLDVWLRTLPGRALAAAVGAALATGVWILV